MDQTFKWFEDAKMVAVIRSSSAEDAEEMIKAATQGGFRIFEISMQTPQAVRLLENYSKKENFLFGAGTVTDGEMAQRAINAGAKFMVSQYTDRDVINVAKNNDSFVIQGALTPTEAFNAHQFGADLVQIFPVGFLGGAQYIKFLRGPMPFIKFAADGADITPDNLLDYLKHCTCVMLGNSLFDKPLVRSDKWSEIVERAKQFTQKIDTLKIAK